MKKLIILFIFTCAILIPEIRDCFGQTITWERIYNGPGNNSDGARSICQADGDNMYVVGYTWITGSQKRMHVLKLNKFGDTLWTRILGDHSGGRPSALAVTSSGDGGCVFTGTWDSAFTIKLNPQGDIVWQKKYMAGNILLYDIKKTIDGGYIACGSYYDGNINGIIVKTDSLGNLQWQKIYPAVFLRTYSSVIEAHDSGYVLTGSIANSNIENTRGFVSKVDNKGDVLWNNTFIMDTITGASRILKINNGYLIGGNVHYVQLFNYTTIYCLKVDLNGDSVQAKLFNTPKAEFLYDFKEINPNRFVITGYSDSIGAFIINGKIRIIDSSWVTISEKTLPSPDYIVLQSILLQNNGDIVIAGEADLNINPYNDTYVIRLDSSLNYTPIGISIISNDIPRGFNLYQNYPNPFNPSTEIKFDLPTSGEVKLSIHDILGRLIETPVEKFLTAGQYKINWNAVNLSSGVYFYTIALGNSMLSKKMLLLK